MQTAALDKIKRLRQNAHAIGSFFDRFLAHTSQTRIDKHGAGFNRDERFSSFKVALSFDNWSGEYGSSSCSSYLVCDRELAKEYVIKAVDLHKEAIFATVAEMMRADAKSLTDAAQAEVAALQEMLDGLTAVPEQQAAA